MGRLEYPYMSFGERKRVRDISGTPILTYKVGSISASSSFIFDIAEDKPVWKKYLPFNSVTVINNGGQAIDVFINQTLENFLHLPNGVIQTYTGDVGIWSLKITNLSATTATTANQIVMQFEREGVTSDSLAKRLASGLLGKLLGY